MVSIIIVHYHVKKELLTCLSSIYKSKPATSFEIIVVDNDEKKSIEKDLKKHFPKVRYIKNNNKGFGQGNNVGASFAKSEYLFFLNPDTTIEKGAIDILGSSLTTHKKIGVVAPILYDTNGNLVPLQGARKLTPLRAIFSFSFINRFFPNNPVKKYYWYLDEWNKNSIKEVESVPGTAFMIRRELFKKIHGFDEKFFLYFEEHDLCERVKESGWAIIMHPQAKVYHALGSSTKQMKRDVAKIFRQSRFYYLKKHFGLLQAIGSETVLRTNTYSVFLILLLIIGAYLRLFNIQSSMDFIGDQGWFYLSARDIVLKNEFPLVGIISSHPWLHQGAFWTYLLGIGMWLFGFSPFVGEYIGVGIDLIAILAIYTLGSTMFSRRLGLIVAGLYATSPIIIANVRMPYHTSPIPLVTIFALYALYKWIQGKIYYFPLLIGLLAVLYNFELATFLLSVVTFVILVFGLVRKKNWARKVFSLKLLPFNLIAFLIPMTPMLLYDFLHGFSQTGTFLIWIGYRILVTFGLPTIKAIPSVSFSDMMYFLLYNCQQLVYSYQGAGAVIIFIFSAIILLLQTYKQKNNTSYVLLGVVNFLLIIGLIAAKTPSDAYLPLLFPGVILLTAVGFDRLINSKIKLVKNVGVIVIVYLMLLNSYSFVQKNVRNDIFTERLAIAKHIVKESKQKEYNLISRVNGKEFDNFKMNYEYLTWWLGHGPSKKPEHLQFIVDETQGEIVVKKYKNNL